MPRCALPSCGRWYHRLMSRHADVSVDGRQFCSIECAQQLIRRRLLDLPLTRPYLATMPDMRVGVWLRHQGAVTADQLERALVEQRESGCRLGTQLVLMGATTEAHVLRALARQASVGYLLELSPDTVAKAPGRLSRKVIQALSLVPFSEPRHNQIKVACHAPLPRTALAAFRRLTGWTPTPYLVADSNWVDLVSAYGVGLDEDVTTPVTETHDLSEAVETIASTLASGRDVRLSEARLDPFTWIRVEGDGVAHDVVLASEGGAPWPAQNMSL
jgi:hypothetical protein